MSTNTSHYNLVKPAGSENYDVSVQNGNMDALDAALWAMPSTYKRSLTTTDDLNSISDGVYYITNNMPQNAPTEIDISYSLFFQISSSVIKHQYIIKPFSSIVFVREYSGTPAWQAWKAIGRAGSGTISTGINYKKYGNIITIYINNVSVSASSGWSTLATLPSGYGSPDSVHVKSIDGTDLRVSGTSLDYRGSASTIYGTITYVI